MTRARVREIIFETNTPAGKAFDIALIACILLSVLSVMLDSVQAINRQIGGLLYGVEWFFTILFTVEYALRLWSVQAPLKYARSFYGVIDLLGILPTYLSLLLVDSQYLLVVRVLARPSGLPRAANDPLRAGSRRARRSIESE